MKESEKVQLQKIKKKLTPVEVITLNKIITRRNKVLGIIVIIAMWTGCIVLIFKLMLINKAFKGLVIGIILTTIFNYLTNKENLKRIGVRICQ